MGAQCRIGFQPVPDATEADRFCLHSPAAMQRDGHISLWPAFNATRRIRLLFTSLPFGTGWKPIPHYGAMGAQCRIGFQPVPHAKEADRFCLHSPAAMQRDGHILSPAFNATRRIRLLFTSLPFGTGWKPILHFPDNSAVSLRRFPVTLPELNQP